MIDIAQSCGHETLPDSLIDQKVEPHVMRNSQSVMPWHVGLLSRLFERMLKSVILVYLSLHYVCLSRGRFMLSLHLYDD